MKKSILAIAVGAALAAAGAAQAEVAISGLAHMSVDSIDDGNESSIYVSSNSSKLTFKGSEELSEGLKGNWMFDTAIVMDGSGTSVFDRETYVGLSGGFGSFNIGKQDTPMKKLGRKIDFFGDQIGDSRSLIAEGTLVVRMDMNSDGDYSDTTTTETYTGTSTGTGASTVADSARSTETVRETETYRSFGLDARPGNALVYTTPDMGGISASLIFVPEDGTKDASMFDIGVTYSGGPLFVGFAYESHGEALNSESSTAVARHVLGTGVTGSTENQSDVDSANGETESAIRLGVSYAMGDAKIAGLVQSVTNSGGFDGADRTTFGLGGSYKIGAATIKLQYYMAGEYDLPADAGKDTGSTLLAIGGDYALSKSTTVYAAYAMVSSDEAGAAAINGPWHPSANYAVLNSTSGEAEDQSAISFGVKHSF